MSTERTVDQVRAVLRPYALLYLGELCKSYQGWCEEAFMAHFRPEIHNGPELKVCQSWQEIELKEIETLIRDIRSVDK